MRIAVANLKGGVGKTSSAVLLGEAAAERGASCLLVDCDPQGSAMRWADEAAADGDEGLRSVAVSLPTPDIGRRLGSIAGGHTHVLLDTPPGDERIVRGVIGVADVVVVPTKPTTMDFDRLSATLEMATRLGVPAVVLLSQARAGTRLLADAKASLEEAEIPTLATVIPQREAIAAAFGTRPTAALLQLYAEVLDELEAALAEPLEV